MIALPSQVNEECQYYKPKKKSSKLTEQYFTVVMGVWLVHTHPVQRP